MSTRTEARRAATVARQDENRARQQRKDAAKAARDSKLREINKRFGARTTRLQDERRAALKQVWDEWNAA